MKAEQSCCACSELMSRELLTSMICNNLANYISRAESVNSIAINRVRKQFYWVRIVHTTILVINQWATNPRHSLIRLPTTNEAKKFCADEKAALSVSYRNSTKKALIQPLLKINIEKHSSKVNHAKGFWKQLIFVLWWTLNRDWSKADLFFWNICKISKINFRKFIWNREIYKSA